MARDKFTTNDLLTMGRLKARLAAAYKRQLESFTKGAFGREATSESDAIGRELDKHLFYMAQYGSTFEVQWVYDNCIGQGMAWDATMQHLYKHYSTD